MVANEHEHPELFWAIRGAGANFGVVVAFDFVVEEVDQVGLAFLTYRVQDPAGFLVAFGEVASGAPRDTTAELIVGSAGPGPLIATVVAMVNSTKHDDIVSRLGPCFALAPLDQQQVAITPYAGVMNLQAGGEQPGQGERGGSVRPADGDHARLRRGGGRAVALRIGGLLPGAQPGRRDG